MVGPAKVPMDNLHPHDQRDFLSFEFFLHSLQYYPQRVVGGGRSCPPDLQRLLGRILHFLWERRLRHRHHIKVASHASRVQRAALLGGGFARDMKELGISKV